MSLLCSLSTVSETFPQSNDSMACEEWLESSWGYLLTLRKTVEGQNLMNSGEKPEMADFSLAAAHFCAKVNTLKTVLAQSPQLYSLK